MRLEFIFLSTFIIVPYSLGENIDVSLQPLIDVLKQLWPFEALTYDVARKHNFKMKTILIWTINDFIVYDMVLRYSTRENFFFFFLLPEVLVKPSLIQKKTKKTS
jgi:hypothetical protein